LSWYLFISIDFGIPLSPSAGWGKPFDIYRQQKIVQSFEDGRRMLEEVPSITPLSPLLLVAILHDKFEDATSSGSFGKCDQISKGTHKIT
jgi:hypothetical protein